MKSIEALSNRLLDIEMPTAPVEIFDYGIVLTIISVSALIIFLIYYFLQSSNLRNLRLLSQLKANLLSSQVAPKTACYQLAELLKATCKKNHLTNTNILRPELENRWKYFILKLSEYRYESGDIDKADVIKLIDESKNWIRVLRP